MSERHIDAEGERRLTEAGFVPMESHIGKRRWRDPEDERVMPAGVALDKVERTEEQELEEAGWERVEAQGRISWATCTLVGPPTTCTSVGAKGEGRIITTAQQFQTCGISIYHGPHEPY